MINRLGIVLRKTSNAFESKGVLNPAIIKTGNQVHMLYRAFKKGNFSTIGYACFEGPLHLIKRADLPVFYPDREEDIQGVEDPRISKIDNIYYLTYTAYDGHNALGSLAISTDLIKFEKMGIITPKVTFIEYNHAIAGNIKLSPKYMQQYHFLSEHGMLDRIPNYLVWDKNVMLFPEKLNGKFVLLHRLFPGIQMAYFNDFSELTAEFWMRYLFALDTYILMDPIFNYETSHIGGGCPPIKTEYGWLFIYHAVEVKTDSNIYHISVALLDLNNPQKVIARLKQPLLSPHEEWEEKGYVNNVCFPTGTAIFEKDLYIYYGAADSNIAVAKVNMPELLNELLTNNLWDNE